MPNLYTQLHRRYGTPDGITRREMLQRSLAAAGGAAAQRAARRRAAAAQSRPGRRHRRRLQRPGGGLRAVAGRLRRHRRRGAQPRRRPRDQLLRSRPGQERRGRRRADRVEPSDLGRRTRSSSSSSSSTSTEEDAEAPIVLERQAADGGASRKQLWEEMEKAFNTHRRRRREGRRPIEPWTAANAEALDKRTLGRRGSTGSSASPLCKTGAARDDDGRQRRRHRVAELSRQPGDGEGRRPREVLDRIARSIAARAATSSWRRKLVAGDRRDAACMTRTPVRVDRRDRQRRARHARAAARCSRPITCCSRRRRATWNRIAFDPVLPPALAPQMGTQRQVPDRR